jgi:hypothetical protein
MRILVRFFAAVLLAAGVLVVPAIAAEASSGITVEWISDIGSSGSFTYPCTSGTHTYNPNTTTYYVSYVSDNCGGRVWLHALPDGSGNSYCISPGDVAYGFTSSFRQILVSTNQFSCDDGVQLTAGWSDGQSLVDQVPAYCTTGQPYTDYTTPISGPGPVGYLYLFYLTNKCHVRIWAHENPDGSGGSYCISPGTTFHITDAPFQATQFIPTANQAPCSAG